MMMMIMSLLQVSIHGSSVEFQSDMGSVLPCAVL